MLTLNEKGDIGLGPGSTKGSEDPRVRAFANITEAEWAILKQITRSVVGGGVAFDSRGNLFAPDITHRALVSSPADRERARLEAEEARLREPVARYLLATEHALAWEDVVGNEAARDALIEAIEHPVRHAELYRHYARKPAKGVLLYGPPGCGKTLFGKAAASVLSALHGRKASQKAGNGSGGPVLLSIKGPEIQSPYVGETERTIRAIYAYARAFQALRGFSLTIFIDEADAILPSRDGTGGRRARPWEESQVAAFLAEMDGLDGSGAFTILATNRPQAIDEAILRDGRCDRKIRIARPNRAASERILAKAFTGVPLADAAGQSGEGAREAMAEAAADAFWSEGLVVARLDTDRGPRQLLLRDIVSGAMLVGLVERTKALAFRRDLAAGGAPGGVRMDDVAAAIAATLSENAGLGHGAALDELAEREGLRTIAPMTAPASPPPLYGLDASGAVVRVQ